MNDRQNDGKTGSGFHPSRRDFLTRAGLLAGGMALMGVPGFRPQHATAATADSRIPAGGSSALELDGQFIDFLKSAEGGFPKAEVIQEKVGQNLLVKKRIGPPKYQDISIQCSPAMPKPLFDWIAATLNMSSVRKTGAIITADFNGKEQSRLQFNNALITEFGIPACDGSSKEPGYLTVKFSPEFTSPLAGKGSVLKAVGAKSKAWLPSNFRLTIPGLDCSKVSKIDALTIKQSVAQNVVGQMRDFQKEPARLEFPNLVLSIAQFSAGTFYAWFQDMVIKGNAGENNEKAGTLEFFDPTLKSTLFTIYFHHLGIFGFTPEKSEANAETIKRVKVEMYCEQMTLVPVKI
jgi:hypothetical protein